MSVSYEKLDLESSHGIHPLEASSSSSLPPKSLFSTLFNSDALTSMKKGFTSLKSCPRELYTNFFLKFCESYGYFALSQVLVIYLHNEFNCSDIEAGFIYGMWGICITFWGLVGSFVNDNMGVRRSLMVGFSISFCSSIIIALTTSKNVLCFMLFCILPIGTAMGIPMLTVGIKRYTTSVNRGFAFGLYYAVMNVAAFAAGPIIDISTIYFNGTSFFGRSLSGNRMTILTTTCTYAMSLVAAYYLREIKVTEECESTTIVSSVSQPDDTTDGGDVEMTSRIGNSGDSSSRGDSEGGTVYSPLNSESPRITRRSVVNREFDDDGEESTVIFNTIHSSQSNDDDDSDSRTTHSAETSPESNSTAPVSSSGAKVEVYQPKTESFWATAKLLIYSKTFWRFTVLTLFLINLRTIFRHLDATLPTYLVRNFGPDYPKGMIYSINPFMIIWLTPLVAALTTTSPHFDMIKYGGYVSAVSPFFMAMSTSTWAVVMFVVLLSLGEALWSPRMYDYTMSVAPEGREASFSALASAPLFAAKVPVGLLSGYLLQTYLPEDGSRSDGRTLWLIVGLLTITSPILITLFEPCIREPVAPKK